MLIAMLYMYVWLMRAYYIGPAQASQSYLRIPTIIEIAKYAGVEAIHPGYGFVVRKCHFC